MSAVELIVGGDLGWTSRFIRHVPDFKVALPGTVNSSAKPPRQVSSAEEALEALAAAAARGAPFEIVIVDSMLAGMAAGGLMTAIAPQPALAKARVVVLIPVGRAGTALEAQYAGMASSISKPVGRSALHDCLVNALTGTLTSAAGASGTAPLAVSTQGSRVLLVEDNRVNQQVDLGILKIEGCHVTVANDGAEAVEAFARSTFDIILMDCHMPQMDGFEATKRIRDLQSRQKLARVPIIALTANAMQQDREDCLKAGMDDHLAKPYSRSQMRAMLERWLARDSGDTASGAHEARRELQAV